MLGFVAFAAASIFHVSMVQARSCAAAPVAASVAASQAQGEKRELCAVPGRATARTIRTHPPCEANGRPSAGEGIISSESRMREFSASRLTSGGVETRP